MQKAITSFFSIVTFISISSSAGQFDFLVGVWSPSPACSTIRLGQMGATAPIVIEKVSDTILSLKICKGSTFSKEKKSCELLGKGMVTQLGNHQILLEITKYYMEKFHSLQVRSRQTCSFVGHLMPK